MSGDDDAAISSRAARELCQEAVQIWKESVGRGATYAKAYGTSESVTMLFRDVLTKAEASQLAQGHGDLVRRGRRVLFESNRARMIEAVERSSSSPVETAFYDIDPDCNMCTFTFVFERAAVDSERSPVGITEEIHAT